MSRAPYIGAAVVFIPAADEAQQVSPIAALVTGCHESDGEWIASLTVFPPGAAPICRSHVMPNSERQKTSRETDHSENAGGYWAWPAGLIDAEPRI